jgi:hypothetical protein
MLSINYWPKELAYHKWCLLETQHVKCSAFLFHITFCSFIKETTNTLPSKRMHVMLLWLWIRWYLLSLKFHPPFPFFLGLADYKPDLSKQICRIWWVGNNSHVVCGQSCTDKAE